MEASALQHSARLPALAGRSPLLRLQSDEKLIALIRRGHHGAFEALVQRYQPRLLAFCRHMLGSQEDAEDVLQEVFAASFNAICADDRPINARPWLYRIARNRCLNHLRRAQPTGQDSMDIFEGDGGITTADTVHKREEFRQIVADVQELPETQRTALLLREIDALSYEQIAEAMDTTVPSVKSLLVRARVSLAEASEARLLTCDEVRLELGQVAEGIAKSSAPVRRHLKACDRCRIFKGELRKTNKALAAVFPLGPLLLLKKFGIAKLGIGAGGAAAASSAARGRGRRRRGDGRRGRAPPTAAGGFTASGAVSAGISHVATKAAAGMAAAVIVTAGAVEVRHAANEPARRHRADRRRPPRRRPRPAPAPRAGARKPRQAEAGQARRRDGEGRSRSKPVPAAEPVAPPRPRARAGRHTPAAGRAAPVQEEGSTVVVPDPPATPRRRRRPRSPPTPTTTPAPRSGRAATTTPTDSRPGASRRPRRRCRRRPPAAAAGHHLGPAAGRLPPQ